MQLVPSSMVNPRPSGPLASLREPPSGARSSGRPSAPSWPPDRPPRHAEGYDAPAATEATRDSSEPWGKGSPGGSVGDFDDPASRVSWAVSGHPPAQTAGCED